MNNILNYRKSIFSSKLGEDGIIEYIFSIIKPPNFSGMCIEFGAHNGIFNSNTRNLIVNKGWRSIQIEGDSEKIKDCVKNYIGYPVTVINSYVDYKTNTLDNILKNNYSGEINLISIDIDGLDYEIFESTEIKPDIFLIEVQAGNDQLTHEKTPTEISKNDFGQGLTVMTDLANKKGYELIAYTGNAFYIKKEYYSLLNIDDNSPETIFMNFWKILSVEDKEWLKNNCIKLGLHNKLMY